MREGAARWSEGRGEAARRGGPDLQFFGGTLAVEQYPPSVQGSQSVPAALFVLLEKRAAGNGSGADAPIGQYDPATHGLHSVRPSSSWNVPPAHAVHWSAPAAE